MRSTRFGHVLRGCSRAAPVACVQALQHAIYTLPVLAMPCCLPTPTPSPPPADTGIDYNHAEFKYNMTGSPRVVDGASFLQARPARARQA